MSDRRLKGHDLTAALASSAFGASFAFFLAALSPDASQWCPCKPKKTLPHFLQGTLGVPLGPNGRGTGARGGADLLLVATLSVSVDSSPSVTMPPSAGGCTSLWESVSSAAFGEGGGLRESSCCEPGSAATALGDELSEVSGTSALA